MRKSAARILIFRIADDTEVHDDKPASRPRGISAIVRPDALTLGSLRVIDSDPNSVTPAGTPDENSELHRTASRLQSPPTCGVERL